MVYKNIKLTSSDLNYKAVPIVVNTYVVIQAYLLIINCLTNVDLMFLCNESVNYVYLFITFLHAHDVFYYLFVLIE